MLEVSSSDLWQLDQNTQSQILITYKRLVTQAPDRRSYFPGITLMIHFVKIIPMILLHLSYTSKYYFGILESEITLRELSISRERNI